MVCMEYFTHCVLTRFGSIFMFESLIIKLVLMVCISRVELWLNEHDDIMLCL